MTVPLFRSLDSAAMAKDIRTAQHSICYAAPGIQDEPAKASFARSFHQRRRRGHRDIRTAQFPPP